MKNFLGCFVVTLVVASLAFSCGGKHEEEAAEDEWKEMDDFHLVMAEVYHPLKDSGDLAPIKSRASELAASAETWASADVPEKMDNDEVKGMLEKLQGGASDLASQIESGAPDEDISAQLTSLHDLFHQLQEKWYEEGAVEHGHQH